MSDRINEDSILSQNGKAALCICGCVLASFYILFVYHVFLSFFLSLQHVDDNASELHNNATQLSLSLLALCIMFLVLFTLLSLSFSFSFNSQTTPSPAARGVTTSANRMTPVWRHGDYLDQGHLGAIERGPWFVVTFGQEVINVVKGVRSGGGDGGEGDERERKQDIDTHRRYKINQKNINTTN